MKRGLDLGVFHIIPLLLMAAAPGITATATAGDSLAATRNELPILPLDTVLSRVLARNPELRMWELRAQGRSEAARGATAWMAPEFGVGGNELPYGGGTSDMTPGDPALMLSVLQMIPGPGKRGARQRHLASLADRDRAEGRWMRSQLLADAKSQYFRMVTTTRKLGVLREAEEVMAFMLEVAEVRFKLRQSDLATVFEARARLEELKTMGTREESMRKQAGMALALLMASPEQAAFAPDTALRLRGYAESPEPVDLDRRGDIAMVGREIKSMELNLEVMRSQGRPDFGFQFNHMEMLDMGRRFSAMAMMTLPLAPWSSGMVRADVASMEKDIESMQSELEARRLMARRMATEMRLMLQSETAQFTRFEQKVTPAYRKSLDASMAAYQEGAGDLFRVLDTWDRWVMARMEALEHLEKALVLEAEYERESGRL